MKLNLNVDLKKLVNDVRGPKGAAALTEEFNRISTEIKKISHEVKPQAQAQIKRAEKRYQDLLKKLHTAQKDLDKEVAKRVLVVKKQAKEVEKNLGQYKKLALEQKTKIQTALMGNTKKTTKKAATKKTSKKASGAKRSTKKTSSKVAAT
jgi:SMC interacting uncharacterized protein involved in chromosome segregation